MNAPGVSKIKKIDNHKVNKKPYHYQFAYTLEEADIIAQTCHWPVADGKLLLAPLPFF